MVQIDLNALMVSQEELFEVKKKIKHGLLELEMLQHEVRKWCLQDEVLRQIDREQIRLFKQMHDIDEMAVAVEQISMLYDRNENRLIHYAEQRSLWNIDDFIMVKDFSYLTGLLRNILGE